MSSNVGERIVRQILLVFKKKKKKLSRVFLEQYQKEELENRPRKRNSGEKRIINTH